MTQQTDDDRERDEWLEQRRHGIGGSDAAAALGLSPWKTPLSLYLEKTGDARPFRDNESMLWGRVLEPAIRAEYTRRTGIACASGAQLTHPKYPWMRATLDGLSNERQPRVVEIKTARTDRGWGEPGTDDVPQTYLLQCVHYMVVTGAQLADIALLVGGQDFRIYTVQRNAALADLVVEGEHEFWQHVQRREPPEAKTLAEINMRYRQSQSRQVELSPDAAHACAQLAAIRAEILERETEAEQCEALIKSELLEADAGIVDGVVACTWRTAKPSQVFDKDNFKSEFPDLWKQYQTERAGSRRFLLKGAL
jgi:putative phage-type endonuclease